jgi:hypothetical protein
MNYDDQDDIFASWKNNKFVSIDHSLFGRWSIILTDFNYWTEHTDELVEWCTVYGADTSGMVIEFPDEQTMTLFVLRWS